MALFAAVALASCGDDDPGEPPGETSTEAAETGGKTRVAALGDSITSGSPLYDPDPAQRQTLGFGDDEKSQFEYWASEADASLEFDNCGVFGERTDEIAVRLENCAEGADVLIVQGGINDIAQSLQGGPQAATDAVSAAAENLDAMVRQGQDLGLDVAITEVLPWNNGHPVADEPIAELNDAIAKIAKEREVTLLGFYDALESGELGGTMAPGYTDDGDHPSIDGYRVLGELVAMELG